MKFNFNLPSISKKREEFNFDHSHTLTHNFGVSQVISAIDVKPNDDVNIDLSAFTRLMPLPCPSYGGVKLVHRAYHVPFNFCMRNFDNFVAMQKHPTGLFGSEQGSVNLSGFSMPYFTARDLFKAIFKNNPQESNEFIDVADSWSPGEACDVYAYINTTESSVIRYTAKGRRLVSWLAQLGYKLPNTYNLNDYDSNMKYDVCALLAFWKFYLDWVVPARFVYSNPNFIYIKSVLDDLDPCVTSFHFTSHTGSMSDTEIDLSKFLQVPTGFLDDDFYTTAFQTPYGVENDGSLFADNDPKSLEVVPLNGGADIAALGTASVGQEPRLKKSDGTFQTSNGSITQLTLLSLGRLQQLVNTKKVTSTSVLEWLKANYGIAPSRDSLHLSTYLGSSESQIMIGDVMATASTQLEGQDPTYVGQFAGKGLGGSSAKWHVKADSFGIVFVIADIVTKSSYVNGVSPLRRRFSPLSFYNEKFDNVGVRAIRHSELVYNTFTDWLNDDREDDRDLPSLDSIFGFQPRYAEYKHKDDMVSGDFMFPSVNKGLDSWYLNRKFKILDDPKIGLEFLSATSDSVGSQYDRIFQNTNNVDHFYSVYRIDVRATSLMEKLFNYFKTLKDDSTTDNNELDVAIN